MSRLRDDGVTIPPVRERRHGLRCRDRRCRSSGSPSSRWPPPRCLRQAAATPRRRVPLARSRRARGAAPVRGRRRPTRAGVRRGRRCATDRAREPENRTAERACHRLRRADRPRRDARRALRRGLPRRPRPARRRRQARDDARPPAAGDRGRGVAVRRGLRSDDERRSRTHLGLRPDRPDPGSGRARPAARSRVRPRRRHPRRRGLAAGPADRSRDRTSKARGRRRRHEQDRRRP